MNSAIGKYMGSTNEAAIKKSIKKIRREKNLFHGRNDQIWPMLLLGPRAGVPSMYSLNNKNKTNTSTHYPA